MKKRVMEKELCVISPISVHKMKKIVTKKELCIISPISGFGRKETDEEHPHVCRKRKRKQVAAALDSAVEPRRSSRICGYSNRRNNRSEKLNSIDFERYVVNICSKLPEDKKNSFECLDSMWFSSYTTKHFKPKVLRWIKNIDIFSKKYVFVPIVLWDHWCLLIFCHLGESLESESPTPCMLLLDSLQMADPLRFEPEIRKFVSDIFNIEERPESQQLINKIRLLVPKVPQQRNDTDCGRFVLYYISRFLESAPETFSISEGYPYFMKRNWFTPGQLKSFWQELQSETKETSSDGSFSGSEDVKFVGIEYETESDM